MIECSACGSQDLQHLGFFGQHIYRCRDCGMDTRAASTPDENGFEPVDNDEGGDTDAS